MKVLCALLSILFCISARTQSILPSGELRALALMIDSLSYVESPEFEENYTLTYLADSGLVGLSIEKFFKGTYKKTPDQYFKWFRLSDIDPSTVAIKKQNDYHGLIFFTGNNKRLINGIIYVDGEAKMPSEGDRMSMGYWQEETDKALLRRIRKEWIRLIDLSWEGNPPQYHTDIELKSALIVNGEEIVFSGGNHDEREIFIVADQMPLFGDATSVKESDRLVQNYFKSELKVDNIRDSGSVYASFYIEKDGSLSNINLIKGCGNDLDDLILIYLRSMPKWKPGMIDGESVVVVLNMELTH